MSITPDTFPIGENDISSPAFQAIDTLMHSQPNSGFRIEILESLAQKFPDTVPLYHELFKKDDPGSATVIHNVLDIIRDKPTYARELASILLEHPQLAETYKTASLLDGRTDLYRDEPLPLHRIITAPNPELVQNRMEKNKHTYGSLKEVLDKQVASTSAPLDRHIQIAYPWGLATVTLWGTHDMTTSEELMTVRIDIPKGLGYSLSFTHDGLVRGGGDGYGGNRQYGYCLMEGKPGNLNFIDEPTLIETVLTNIDTMADLQSKLEDVDSLTAYIETNAPRK